MSELLDNLRARHYAAVRDRRDDVARMLHAEIKHIEALRGGTPRWWADGGLGQPIAGQLLTTVPEPRIDGATHDGIRTMFARNMMSEREHYPLTPAQIAWAREDWSAQLRAKVQATKERERNRITCEPNWIED